MEDDDEFGDLYTDVLRPFQSSSAFQPPPVESKPPSSNRPIDLNISSDDEEILFGAPDSNPKFNLTSSHQNRTLDLKSDSDSGRDLNLGGKRLEVEEEEGLATGVRNWASDFPEPSVSKVSESSGNLKLLGKSFVDPNLMDASGNDVVVEESDEKDDVIVQKDGDFLEKKENFEKFDIEEVDTGIGDLGSGPLIPGITGVADAVDNGDDANFVMREEASGEGDDWDSDSEDDLQIVLNDNNHGPMVMEQNGAMGSDDEDEDGDPLVIVADSEPGLQPMEEQEWGEDAAQAMDGERKELADAAKGNGGVAVATKIGFSNHAYHPYHSQFKYVRPGAAPITGTAPVATGGAPGQVRPPINIGPVSGRGRGDWRPVQKSFHPGYGVPVWGNNTSGRGFGSGLDFTLPSHKTIFEVDVDSFEEKPWRNPAIDVSDFFNFSLNEDSWKDYCKQLEQLRLETTMQSKIRVYESGRTEQEYDPDLPPELAAAAASHDISSGNGNLGKTDAGQGDVSKGSTRVRPPLPTGRAIQVETGYGERLPSIDTRPPRIRDSDAIIEIVCTVLQDDDSFQGNNVTEQLENGPSREDFGEGNEIEGDVAEEDTEHFNGFPRAHNGRNKELVQDNLTPEAAVQHSPRSRGKASSCPGRDFDTLHEERRTKGRAHDQLSSMTHTENRQGKRYLDNQKEDSVESIGVKHMPRLSPPVTFGSAEELGVEHEDGLHNELLLADGGSGMDGEDLALDATATDTYNDENPSPSMKKQKLSSRVELSSLQEIDDGGDSKAARSSENSKARSGSSRDHAKLSDSVDEEVIQHERSARMGNLKRSHGEDDKSMGKDRGERFESEKHRLMEKNWEDSHSHRDWDPYSAHYLHGKPEINRRKERENSEVAWQQRDVDHHGRRIRGEDTRKREHGDEVGSRHKVEIGRMDKDEHLGLRKHLDNGSLRVRHDNNLESRRVDRDDNLKSRYENIDDLHSKRRKEEEYLRRDAEKEEIFRGHRENIRKRDDQGRMRDDDRRSVRHKEGGGTHRERSERQREQDELHRIKQSHEESLLKREREEGRGGVMSGRAAEDKSWTSHGRVKDEYRGSDRDYLFKDTGRRSEQLERRDRVEEGRSSQYRGREDVHARREQLIYDEKRSRQEKGSVHNDRGVSGSDKNRGNESHYKETRKKGKEYEGVVRNSMGPSKRSQEDQSGRINEPVKGTTEQGSGKHEILSNLHASRKHKGGASSDDEQQDLKRGRSKLERWTSHKERDFSIGTKSSSSLKTKEINKDNNDDSSNRVETIVNKRPLGDEKDAADMEIKNVDAKSLEDKHLDTVAKLKKRSERFKLPMPSEKEAMVIKKMESEPLPSAQNEVRADSEIKPERPARKRRWISN